MAPDVAFQPSQGLRPIRRKRGRKPRASPGRVKATGSHHLPQPPPKAAPSDPTAKALAALEAVLVAQLRLAQTLDALADQERLALGMDTPAALAEVMRAKVSCLDELTRLELERNEVLAAWPGPAGPASEVTLEDALRLLDPAAAQRLTLYRLGIEAHLERCRALRPANRALAACASARHLAWRHFLAGQAEVVP